ncbi:UDP-2,3-diacylglucosamine diphosphatase [Fodinibius sp. Rm-B-1B1-1]|uniref:UDP-2,3-diacylglucosamine diphosphatase n=1 Tax=Fodinibius alkaliphilus TaxID=3140241 RepID=UPI003159D5F6
MDGPALNPPLLFISDVHLGGFSKSRNARIQSELIQLINYCQRNDIRIAILGDLFDYWMEYPNTIPKLGKSLLDRFETFNKQMGPTLFITGNHDNWTRDHLSNRGFYLVHEDYVFHLDDKQFLTLHGDGLADPAYKLERPLMHRFLRAPSFVKFFQSLFPPNIGIAIMKHFSRITRKMDWDPQKEKKLNNWAKTQLKSNNHDVILCGHDHIPRKKQFPFGTYINLGTFYEHRSMVYYNKNEINLVCWEVNSQTLKQFKNDRH